MMDMEFGQDEERLHDGYHGWHFLMEPRIPTPISHSHLRPCAT